MVLFATEAAATTSAFTGVAPRLISVGCVACLGFEAWPKARSVR